MIKIAITVEAYEAIASTVPLGAVAFEKELDANGQMPRAAEPRRGDRLRAMRWPGETGVFWPILFVVSYVRPTGSEARAIAPVSRASIPISRPPRSFFLIPLKKHQNRGSTPFSRNRVAIRRAGHRCGQRLQRQWPRPFSRGHI